MQVKITFYFSKTSFSIFMVTEWVISIKVKSFSYLLLHYKLNVMIGNSFKQTHTKKPTSKTCHQQLYFNKQQLQALKQQLLVLPETFEIFKEQTTAIVKEWMGRISSLVYRQAKQKVMLESQLQKGRQVQHTMRCQVIQLKEMINQAMNGYTKQIQQKNNEITKLKEMLQKSAIVQDQLNKEQGEKIDQDLEIIQEESEQTTFSSVNSLRDSKTQDKISEKVEKSVFYEDNSPILDSKLSPSSQNQDNFQYHDKGSRKTKSFIENFRKTIEKSQAKAEQSIKPVTNVTKQLSLNINQKQNIDESHQSISVQHIKMHKQTIQQPLNVAAPLQNNIYVNTPLSFVNDTGFLRPKITFNIEQRDISSFSSSSQLTRGSEEPSSQNVFEKKCQTHKNHLFLKKKEKQHFRIMTEPSPQRIRPSHNYFSNKPVQTPSHIRKSLERPHSYEQNKSVKSSVSKEKIKVTCKMRDETSQPRRNTKAIVYLGGKSLFRKFLIELKEAFKKLITSVGINQDEVKYEGQRRSKMRWGTGRLFYRNGMMYQGQFRQNMRHGRGSLYLNGISIYEGEWKMDRIQGQGYLKSMKYMSKECPSIFNQASYCGNLQDNRLHGIGTIFLNPKQKIVTKFSCGVPVGELTYYNLHQIQFGVWPSQ